MRACPRTDRTQDSLQDKPRRWESAEDRIPSPSCATGRLRRYQEGGHETSSHSMAGNGTCITVGLEHLFERAETSPLDDLPQPLLHQLEIAIMA